MKNKQEKDEDVKPAETPAGEEAVKTAATGESPAATGQEDAGEAVEPAKEQASAEPSEPDWKKLYAITLADFDNYKKRAARDREDVYRYAEADILKDVLPVVDNLSLALANAKDPEDDFVKGVRLVYDGLLKALADHGAKPMEELLGKELDPNFHEAIATLPNEEYEEGRISNIVKTGWMLNDKLLRAAQVVVSAGKSNG